MTSQNPAARPAKNPPASKSVDVDKIRTQNSLMAIQKKMSPEQMREHIHSLRGKYQMVPDGKSFNDWMADLNREEKELEERKLQRHMALGKNSSLARLRGKLNRIKRAGFAKRAG